VLILDLKKHKTTLIPGNLQPLVTQPPGEIGAVVYETQGRSA
jgi:hypothetical protein